MLQLKRHFADRSDRVGLAIDDLIVAGWTGRDAAALEHHIEELAAIGVPRPSAVPLFYRLSASLLTTADAIDVVGGGTSGEVETVIFSLADGLWVGLGSDHTDRNAEAQSVALSKQLCQKPLAGELWRYDEVVDHWDALVLRAYAVERGERKLYQHGAVAAIRHPRDLMQRYAGDQALLPAGSAMFCGTLSAIGGIRPAERFEIELEDPVLKRSIRHGYDIRSLPLVS